MKKFIFVFFVLIIASPAYAVAPLVPCGTEFVPCTPCHLFTLADRVMDFILKGLALPVLVIALLAGGVIWATAAGSPEKITQGRKIITGSIIGIFIAFGGWLIVDTIIVTLGAKNAELKVGKNATIGWAWNKIDKCPEPVVAPPATGGDGIEPPKFINDFEANKANANLLTNSGVTFGGGGSCVNTNGQNVSAATNLAELQNGGGLTVCQNGCSATFLKTCQKNSNTLNPKLLPALFTAKQSAAVDFTVTSLATGDHAQNSDHYQGSAADIVPKVPTPENYQALKNQLRILSGFGNRVECENNKGNIISNCGSGTTHLHVSVK